MYKLKPIINIANYNKVKPIQIISKYILRFDGCSKCNPGLSGIGSVLYIIDENNNENEIWNISKCIGEATNNEAEYKALIIGLEKIIELNIDNILVQGDSLLVIKQINGEYKVRSSNLIPLYNSAKELINNIETINFQHIYRNYNKRADELANIGISML